MKISPKHCEILQNSTGKTQGGVAGGGEWGDRGDIWDRTWVATKWTALRRQELTGETLASPMCFCASRSITCFTAILFWIVLDVRLLPELVRPGLVAELQLRTVPFSNCLAKILRIVDVAGSLIPGNLTLKRWRRSGKKFLPPPFFLWYSIIRKFRCSRSNCGAISQPIKKLCKEFRLIRSTTGYLCLVFKILRRNQRRSGGRGGALPSAPGPENRITSGWPGAEHTTDWES